MVSLQPQWQKHTTPSAPVISAKVRTRSTRRMPGPLKVFLMSRSASASQGSSGPCAQAAMFSSRPHTPPLQLQPSKLAWLKHMSEAMTWALWFWSRSSWSGREKKGAECIQTSERPLCSPARGKSSSMVCAMRSVSVLPSEGCNANASCISSPMSLERCRPRRSGSVRTMASSVCCERATCSRRACSLSLRPKVSSQAADISWSCSAT